MLQNNGEINPIVLIPSTPYPLFQLELNPGNHFVKSALTRLAVRYLFKTIFYIVLPSNMFRHSMLYLSSGSYLLVDMPCVHDIITLGTRELICVRVHHGIENITSLKSYVTKS